MQLRRRFRRYALLVVVVLAVEGMFAGGGGLLFGWLGIFDIAATAQHWPLTRVLLHWAMERSVAAHAGDLPVPPLSDPVLILRGAEHFESDCAPCHGSPDRPPTPTARGMEPPPPPLYPAALTFTPVELHWIVQNGVKFTAMPAWPAQERSDEVWAMVAFLNQLTTMTPPDYEHLVGGDSVNLLLPAAVAPEQEQTIATCYRCHGADGEGRGGAFPVIAGLSDGYLGASLRAYRIGARPSGFMQTIASGLSDAEIDAAAAYYSSLNRAPQPGPFDADLVQAGNAIASRPGPAGAPSCAACHAAQPGNAMAADLRAQSARIIDDQLQLLQAVPPRDAVGAAVVPLADHQLTAAEISAVATYFATQPPG